MKLIYLLGLILIFTACKEKTPKTETTLSNSFDKIEQLQWLVGRWSNITEQEQSYENWFKINDSTLKAHSYTLKQNDTVFAERVTLQQIDTTIAFTVVAYKQNDDKPVTFMLQKLNDSLFTVSNDKHDFPSKITYSNPVKDSIHAWIEGQIDNQPRTMGFYYKKAN